MNRLFRMNWRLWVLYATAVIALALIARVFYEGFADPEPPAADDGADCKKSTDCKTMSCKIVDEKTKLLRSVNSDGSESGKCADKLGKIPGYTPPDDAKESDATKSEAPAAGAESETPADTTGPSIGDISGVLWNVKGDVGDIKGSIGDMKTTMSDIQDKVSSTSIQQIDMSAKLKDFITGHPMQPGVAPDGKNLITAPGVARPFGSTSERPTYPAAVDVEPSTFETYVQTLVKSEMAAQGKPVTEGFQLQEIIANVKGLQRRT